MNKQSYVPVITPLISWIIKVTRRPTLMDEINMNFHSSIGNSTEKIGLTSGANEDRRGNLYIDPRINRTEYFRNR